MAGDGQKLFFDALLFLGSAAIAAPLFKRIGLGTVLGYLCAGIALGPILKLVPDGEEILAASEIGVVLLLFLIGLELRPGRLLRMWKMIAGLGLSQVLVTGIALTGLAMVGLGLDFRAALVAGFGLALSSTAFALQLLEERGDQRTTYGRGAFSILLFQDIAIVPLLAMVAILAPAIPDGGSPLDDIALAVATAIALILAGRYLLNPLFQAISATGAREAMIAAALFVVLGAAMLMYAVGLSMAMGAFISGVMLAESSYRHELEADVEPFRGILLALFFMAVGLSLNLSVVAEHFLTVMIAVPVLMLVKSVIIYTICRTARYSHVDGARIALLLPQGGEFGFILFTAAVSAGLFSEELASKLIVIVILSMMMTPPLEVLARRLFREANEGEAMEEDFEDAGGDVLMIGFSRYGQIASQIMLAGGLKVTIIDHSVERVRAAASFGFRIYFGDGTRRDVLKAAGIEKATIVAVCTHKREITDQIVDLILSEFPNSRLFVRSYDRGHTLALRSKNIEYELRETFESGLVFGRETLKAIGHDDARASEIADDIRRRDERRLEIQAEAGLAAGSDMLHTQPVQPEPLIQPSRKKASRSSESGHVASGKPSDKSSAIAPSGHEDSDQPGLFGQDRSP